MIFLIIIFKKYIKKKKPKETCLLNKRDLTEVQIKIN